MLELLCVAASVHKNMNWYTVYIITLRLEFIRICVTDIFWAPFWVWMGPKTHLETIERACQELQATNSVLCWKVNDLEGHSRQLNLKFVGVAEGAEKWHP